MNESQIEPIKSNNAMFSQGKSRTNEPLSINDSMVEPFKEN
jgi:hypothetical protein